MGERQRERERIFGLVIDVRERTREGNVKLSG